MLLTSVPPVLATRMFFIIILRLHFFVCLYVRDLRARGDQKPFDPQSNIRCPLVLDITYLYWIHFPNVAVFLMTPYNQTDL